MQERIKQIPTKFVEFWNKYTGVQKTIIISVICVVLLAIGLTTYFVSRPTWVKFNEFNNLNDANAMAKALDDANVSHKSSKDGLTLYVHDIHGTVHITIPCRQQRVKRTKSVFWRCNLIFKRVW